MKHTVQEVRAHSALLRDCRINTDALRDKQQDKLAEICSAYADMIECREAHVTDGIVSAACAAYLAAQPEWNSDFPECMRAALLAVWPVAAESVVPLGYLSPQGDRFIPISRWEASMSLGHWTKVFAHPPAQADARTVRPSRVGGRHFAVGSLVQEVIDRAYACYDRYYDPPTAEPAARVEFGLPSGYRMASRDGEYWPLHGDSYASGHAYPTRELAALRAWSQAYEMLSSSMETIRRAVDKLPGELP